MGDIGSYVSPYIKALSEFTPKISPWIQDNKIIVLAMITIGWLAYTMIKNKESYERFYNNIESKLNSSRR